LKQEHLRVILLDMRNRVLEIVQVYKWLGTERNYIHISKLIYIFYV
jgi:hypothetical protein